MAEIRWTPDGWACPHCGTSNPDGGDRCGNCDGNPFVLPSPDELLTAEQLATLKAVTRR